MAGPQCSYISSVVEENLLKQADEGVSKKDV